MSDQYAIAENGIVVCSTQGFSPEAVTESVPLSDGRTLLICGREKQALEARLSGAQEAVKAMERFLSSMSHDIRTPMNAIMGLTVLAKMHLDETARVSDALNKIETAGTHLLSLINDVLDMSRIDSGRMEIRSEAFQLNDLIHEILIMMLPQAEKKRQRLQLETGSIPWETLVGDELRLRQIFVNIISNAVKYTGEEGNILVTFGEETREGDCMLVFVCEDNGIGMSEEFLKKIFEPFERAGSADVNRIEGTGLGMSIVKKLAEAMDGFVQVTSAPGRGTRVTVSVPLRYRREETRSDRLRGKHILVLEADERLRKTYAEYLEEAGAAFVLAGTAEAALNALADTDIRGERTDAVIIGRECGAREDKLGIAAYLHRAWPAMPILLISDDDWDSVSYRAEHSGITSFVPLPLFRTSLINALGDALEGIGPGPESSAYPDLQGRRVLLVEDNMINREIAREILSVTGAQVDTEEDGQRAVERFLSEPPGTYTVILMDVQMPVMDGYEATRHIRESGRLDGKTIPIWAMTANTFAEDIARAAEAGMNGHLAKPIDVSALMQALRAAAGG